MKRKILFLSVALLLSSNYFCYSEETAATNVVNNQSPAQTETVNVSNKQLSPKLVAPVAKSASEKRKETSKKLDLRAVIFDPHADFKAQAEEEGREMTRVEEAEYNLHEALHGKVQSVYNVPRKGLLADYSTIKPEGGIIDSITPWFNYKGGFENIWANRLYQNNVWASDSMTAGFDGRFKNKKTTFRVMTNFLGKEGHDYMNDFWADNYIMHNWSKNDQILIGHARSNVGYEGWLSPFALPFYTRSQLAKNYGNVRDLGVKAQGNHKLYDYSFGLASSGRNFQDWFPGEEFVGWGAIKPLGLTDGRYGNLKLGGGINAGNAENRYTVGSAYLDYEYKRWDLLCEYGSAEGSNGSTGFTANHSEGYVGTLTYQVTPKLHLLARYDRFDPNKAKRNDIRTEYTVGMNYFIKGQSLRLIVNYTFYDIENGTQGTQIVTGLQLVL